MMHYFSESTDNGKLYINYPSIESYKHINALPDKKYLSRFYKLEELVNDGRSQYKAIIGRESVIPDIRRYSKDIFNYLITENIRKAEYIEHTSISVDLLSSYEAIDENNLLFIINQRFLEEHLVPVLNTSLFFICEYNIQLIF